DDVVDTTFGEAPQHLLQLVTVSRGLDEQRATTIPFRRRDGLAMTARIADQADERDLAHGCGRAARGGGGPTDLRQAVEQMNGPVHVGALNPRPTKILPFFPKIQTMSQPGHSDRAP